MSHYSMILLHNHDLVVAIKCMYAKLSAYTTPSGALLPTSLHFMNDQNYMENTVKVAEYQFMQQLLLWYCIQDCDCHNFCVLVHYSYKYLPQEAILLIHDPTV